MPAVKPSTDRPTSCVADDWTPANVEDLAQAHAGPLRVADELAADLVADAGDRHVLLEHRQPEELVPGQGRLAVDQAVDAQRPGGGVGGRREERRVDAVEASFGMTIGVRSATVVERSLVASRIGARSVAGGSADARSGGVALALEEGPAADARDERRDPDGAGPDEERAARPVGHRAAAGVDPARRTVRRHEPAQDPEPDADGHGDRDADDGGRRLRVVQRGEEADDPEGPEAEGAQLVPARCEEPEAGGDDQRDRDDEDLEGELVVGAEQADDEVLGARPAGVDDDLADRRDQRGRAGQEAGEELRGAERGGAGGGAADGGAGVRGGHGEIVPVPCDG